MIARFNSPTITRTICVRRLLFILTSFWADYVASAAAAHQRIHKLAQREAKRNLAGGPSLHCTIPTEGAPSLRFLQGWAAMLPAQLLSVLHRPLCMASSYT